MWSTREGLEAALKDAGLEDWAPQLAGAARHTMILEPGPVDEGAQAPIGASRLGGMPDLPSDVPWPWRPAISPLSRPRAVFEAHAARPWPLSFVTQVDFTEIAAGGLEGFPPSGRLLFFCDPIDVPYGESAEDQTRACVMFIPGPEDRLTRRAFPTEFRNPQHELVRTRDLIFKPRRSDPSSGYCPRHSVHVSCGP